MKIASALVALVLLTAAATPQEAASVAAVDGYFIEDGANATPEVIASAVAEMRDAGSLFYVVILAEDPPAGTSTYAESVLNELPNGEGLVLAESPGSVGWAKNNSIWTTPELNEALQVSLDGSSADEVVTLFVDTLLAEDTSSGGGFPWFLVILALVVVVVGVLVWRSKKNREKAAKATLQNVKQDAQAQIDAVANDILDDEQEVAEANNPEASEHFDKATEIYSQAGDRLANASSPDEVVAISTDLDLAIWHLDCAEAILDGNALPPKPEPPAPPEPEPRPASVGMPPSTATRPSNLEPLPEYQRRSSRRSSFGADDMMKTVLAMQAMKGLSRSGTGSRSRSSSTSSGRSKTSGRARGGGKKRS